MDKQKSELNILVEQYEDRIKEIIKQQKKLYIISLHGLTLFNIGLVKIRDELIIKFKNLCKKITDKNITFSFIVNTDDYIYPYKLYNFAPTSIIENNISTIDGNKIYLISIIIELNMKKIQELII